MHSSLTNSPPTPVHPEISGPVRVINKWLVNKSDFVRLPVWPRLPKSVVLFSEVLPVMVTQREKGLEIRACKKQWFYLMTFSFEMNDDWTRLENKWTNCWHFSAAVNTDRETAEHVRQEPPGWGPGIAAVLIVVSVGGSVCSIIISPPSYSLIRARSELWHRG